MEASRGKGSSNRGSAASKMSAVGKENICPASPNREHLSVSRSPLPEGFPRAPLQDITDILSPIHFQSSGDVLEQGLCRRGLKRSAETQTPSSISRSECNLISSEEWKGLRKCATLQAARSHMKVEVESRLTEGVQRPSLSGLTEGNSFKDEVGPAGTSELKEGSLHCRETRVEEQMLTSGVLKTDVVEPSCVESSLKAMPKRPLKPHSSSLATRARLRSMQDKQMMSNLMKFR